MQRSFAAAMIGVLMCGQATAQDAKSGWQVQYSQDAFSGSIIAKAGASQETDRIAFGVPSLTVLCGPNGGLIADFYDGSMFAQNAISVDFRDTSGDVHTFTFERRKDAFGGNVTAADPATSASLLDLFAATTQSVPFRTGEKQGLLPSIGAALAFDAVRASCPDL